MKNSFELRHERASHSFFEQNKGPLKKHGSSSLIVSCQKVVKSYGHSLFQQVISYPISARTTTAHLSDESNYKMTVMNVYTGENKPTHNYNRGNRGKSTYLHTYGAFFILTMVVYLLGLTIW